MMGWSTNGFPLRYVNTTSIKNKSFRVCMNSLIFLRISFCLSLNSKVDYLEEMRLNREKKEINKPHRTIDDVMNDDSLNE